MAKARVKPIHLITMCFCRCKTICDIMLIVEPIDNIIRVRPISSYMSKGTFNPKKVTCKRCLKHSDYKLAMDKINNPLLYWRENI